MTEPVDSEVVRAFYDRHPYPPPVTDLEPYRSSWQDPRTRRADHHLLWPSEPYREDESILVAGCGTSQAARYAIRHTSARITAIDISSAGLDRTRELRRRYGLTNLELHQLPVERAHELGEGFDRIVCTGVLHHLADPDAGLLALRGALKPSGALHLMVYAPYGRTGIYMLQEYCRRLGVGDTEGEVHDLASVLEILPHHHPLTHLVRESPDFKSPDAVADALLHPQDRSYSVPQLFDLLDRNGLSFGRWYRQAPYSPQCGDLSRTPHAQRLAELPASAAYAAVELLRGTFTRHSVIAYGQSSPPSRGVMPLDNEGWTSAVPLRLPHTLCLRERLPPGASAVLLNQSHQYPDLVLPIAAAEKRLFDAIDGHRTLAEVASQASFDLGRPTHVEQVRDFFERLWRYDQVVFDLSAGSPGDSSSNAAAEGRAFTPLG